MLSHGRQRLDEDKAPEPIVVPRSEHCLSRRNIDPDALKIMYRLARHGFKAYLVGGSVRDLLLRKTPTDFDISTDAHPGEMRKLFRNCRIIGRRFRLVHVFFHGNKIIEVSTFRKNPSEVHSVEGEAEEGHGKGDNTFGEPHEDAWRRDLTINGLFYDIETFSILDYVGGVNDLRDGVARAIGDPETRFREDPLRMIRTVRHAVQAGFRIEENTYAAILSCCPALGEANVSRVQDDVQKDLHRGFFASILRLQMETGLLNAYFKDLDLYLKSGDADPGLFNPAWIWKALSMLDADRSNTEERTRQFRLASVVFPLLEKRLLDQGGAGLETGLHSKEGHQSLQACCAPLGIGRRERECLWTLWSGWMRLQQCVETGRIPVRFQKKVGFGELCVWDGFFRSIKGDSSGDREEQILSAVRSGGVARPRRRRRKKRAQCPEPSDSP